MRRSATVRLVSVWCAMGMVALPSDASAQRVSVEVAGGYDELANELGYGDFSHPLLRRGFTDRSVGGLGIDGRLAFPIGERWELGAAFSLKRATMSLLHGFGCLHGIPPGEPGGCPPPPPETVSSVDYTEVVSALATARFWPMGVVDRSRTVRPLVGLHTGVLWYDNGLGLIGQESVGTTINQGVPIGFDAGVGVAITDRAYLLTYLTGQMLLVGVPEHVFRHSPRRVSPSGVVTYQFDRLEADGFGFRWGIRTGIGFHL